MSHQGTTKQENRKGKKERERERGGGVAQVGLREGSPKFDST